MTQDYLSIRRQTLLSIDKKMRKFSPITDIDVALAALCEIAGNRLNATDFVTPRTIEITNSEDAVVRSVTTAEALFLLTPPGLS
ncbi:hypothetical protein [Rhizobium sp. Leaf384]|uniref:hypothetical protein n=1 Tax=Rhizobium sp. Leaf384 TaxID=1736358 RepID=UPI0012E7B684|nr:hypothetical protein [Rhizobium sp. Leaf384]